MGSHLRPIPKGLLDERLAEAQKCCFKNCSKVDILEYSVQGNARE